MPQLDVELMKLPALLAALAIVQMVAGPAWACTCAPALPPLKALAKADAVFSGEVASIAKRDLEIGDVRKIVVSQVADIAVRQSWKGKISGTVKIHTGGGGGDCGFPFEKGESYLIYAMRDDEGNLTTNICMRTWFLEDAATEVLELEGRLPEPTDPPAPPTFRLIGKIDDAGYEGLIFTLHNRLHERIFLFQGSTNTHCVQVYETNSWVDYAPNCGVRNRKELSQEEASSEFERWRLSYEGTETKHSATYLDRLSSTRDFIAIPTTRKTWRVGLQYLTEAEFDDGKQIQKSQRYIWSEAIVPTKLDLPILAFEQAFEQENEEAESGPGE